MIEIPTLLQNQANAELSYTGKEGIYLHWYCHLFILCTYEEIDQMNFFHCQYSAFFISKQ